MARICFEMRYDTEVVFHRFFIQGVVQGVGFRPYIFNACIERGLTGYVQNTGSGVVAVVSDKETFIEILARVPQNARVDSYTVEEVGGTFTDFTIKDSEGVGYAEIPPDFFLCDECREELNDPKSRRHEYFFTTCTNCGPRFTITKKIPYDRNTTTMDEFPMCEACKMEYTDPHNRRYHAQTIACPDCGPRLTLYENAVAVTENDTDALEKTIKLLQEGEIVAIKGIGGFHLACKTDEETVAKLKNLRSRKDKPFAVMCRDIEMVMSVGNPNEAQKQALLSPERPIVLIPKKNPMNAVSELDTVGIMLPYSALHHLLFEKIGEPLVMTSSNRADEPMSTIREEQLVPYVLDHGREITNAADDSVVKIIAGHTFFIRRSRGYVPRSISIPKNEHTLLALGAEMNNTFCVAKPDGKAILSQHMGNTANLESFERYKETVHRFLCFAEAEPRGIIADLHPGYNTAEFGELLSEELCVPLIKVQHHKAHAYGTALENGLNDFVAIVGDGLGYGEDGTIWGGEIFHNNERVGHLEQHLQVGGDSATRYPAKMLFSILRNFLSVPEAEKYMNEAFSPDDLTLLDKQRTEKFNAPLTSSCGRVLDAAAFLLGFCNERTYDGRPAMLLEANSFGPLPLAPVVKDNVLMTTPLFEFLVTNLEKDKKRLAATVQRYLAEGLYEIAQQFATGRMDLNEVRGAREREAESYSTYGEGSSNRSNEEIRQIHTPSNKPIVWTGGCAYNTIMTGFMLEQGVLVNKNIPAGDGGISFGQIAYVLADPKGTFADECG